MASRPCSSVEIEGFFCYFLADRDTVHVRYVQSGGCWIGKGVHIFHIFSLFHRWLDSEWSVSFRGVCGITTIIKFQKLSLILLFYVFRYSHMGWRRILLIPPGQGFVTKPHNVVIFLQGTLTTCKNSISTDIISIFFRICRPSEASYLDFVLIYFGGPERTQQSWTKLRMSSPRKWRIPWREHQLWRPSDLYAQARGRGAFRSKPPLTKSLLLRGKSKGLTQRLHRDID